MSDTTDTSISRVDTVVDVQSTVDEDPKILRPDTTGSPTLQLPIRGEKRLIPTGISVANLSQKFGGDNSIESDDFSIAAARATFTDYIKVVIPHRGLNSIGEPDTNLDATFRFLINPATVNVNHQTVDSQSFTRGGWQFGVWGDDLVRISMQGITAGQYFALGLTDEYQYFTESYRNLMQLISVFENNGYWFEGEEVGEGPLACATAADFQRRRIKSHQDVQLVVGNFCWYGMFESLTIAQNAETPFSMNFQLSFIAWKERFRTTSPYWDVIPNDVQRGHTYKVQAAQSQLGQMLANSILSSIPVAPAAPTLAKQEGSSTNKINESSPAVVSSKVDDIIPIVDSSTIDINFNDPLFDPQGSGLFE